MLNTNSGGTNKPGSFQTPKLYTCQVSFKTSLSFLLVLKFCTKGEILFEVSIRTPIEVSGLGFLPKGKDADNQRKNTSAKCPVRVLESPSPLQDITTRQKLLFSCPQYSVQRPGHCPISPYPCLHNLTTECSLDTTPSSPSQSHRPAGRAFVTNLCCTLVPSSLPSRSCCHSGRRCGE